MQRLYSQPSVFNGIGDPVTPAMTSYKVRLLCKNVQSCDYFQTKFDGIL
jgi:hypothetical protein